MTKFEDLPNQRSTRPASRGAFFMPLSLPHVAKSFCVNDLLGNIS